MKNFFLLPASLASLILLQTAASSPAVYILMPSNPALAAVSAALNTLGYSHAEFDGTKGGGIGGPGVDLDPATFAVLEPGTAYMNISRDNPEARFILPASTAIDPGFWMGLFSKGRRRPDVDLRSENADSIRAFFAERERERERVGESTGTGTGSGAAQLLELDAFAPGSDAQAQTWVALCDFLGLGYSVVERLKLWHFP